MTVKSNVRKQEFAGAQAAMTYTFKTLPGFPTYIKAKKKLISTGAETELAYTTDYTATVNADGVGGIITSVVTVSTLYTFVAYRETANEQESNYEDYNNFPADTVETDYDRRTLVSQELSEDLDRALTLPITVATDVSTELPVPAADAFLVWNAAGTALVNTTIASAGAMVLSTNSTLGTSDTIAVSEHAIKIYVDTAESTATAYADANFIANSLLSTNSTLGTSDVLVVSENVVKANFDSLATTSYTDRGATSGTDFTVGDFTLDASWNDLNLSAIVPTNATAVILTGVLKTTVIAKTVAWRTKTGGNAATFPLYTQVANQNIYQNLIVGIGTDSIIQYNGGNATFTTLTLYVRGWWT